VQHHSAASHLPLGSEGRRGLPLSWYSASEDLDRRWFRARGVWCCSHSLQKKSCPLEQFSYSMASVLVCRLPGLACVWIVLFRFGPRLRASSYSHVASSLRHVPHGLVLSHRSFLRRQKEHAMDKVESKTASQRDQGIIETIVIKKKMVLSSLTLFDVVKTSHVYY